MTSRTRNVIADLIVGLAIFIVVVWFLRRVFGLIVWGASIIALIAVVVALFALARWVRRG